jgi:hypothetical protein
VIESFAAATAPQPTAEPGRFDVVLDDAWTILSMPNGGYLLAVIARAAAAHLDQLGSPHRWPVAANAIYAVAPSCGPATVTVSVLRAGRSATQLRASLSQDGQEKVAASYTFRNLADGAAPRYETVPPVELAPLADCVRLPTFNPDGAHVGILSVTEEWLDPACLGWATGGPTGVADLRGWVQVANGEAQDPFSLLYAADCLPPATFNLGSVGWVPTLQLSVYVRALPTPGPLRVRQWVCDVADGLADEVCHIWDSSGRLVAQATQLAQVRFADR